MALIIVLIVAEWVQVIVVMKWLSIRSLTALWMTWLDDKWYMHHGYPYNQGLKMMINRFVRMLGSVQVGRCSLNVPAKYFLLCPVYFCIMHLSLMVESYLAHCLRCTLHIRGDWPVETAKFITSIPSFEVFSFHCLCVEGKPFLSHRLLGTTLYLQITHSFKPVWATWCQPCCSRYVCNLTSLVPPSSIDGNHPL